MYYKIVDYIKKGINKKVINSKFIKGETTNYLLSYHLVETRTQNSFKD